MKPAQKVLPILLHGFFMISVNLFSAMAAVLFLHLVHLSSTRWMEASIALVINVVVYFGVYKLMKNIEPRILRLDDVLMLLMVLVMSLALLPTVYYPMYYLMHGGWSSLDNLWSIWPYQVMANGICLILNFYVLSAKIR